MKVTLVNGYYFIVSEHSYDLYHKDPKKKNPTLLGYCSTVERVVKRTIQHNMSRQNGKDITMTEFLEKAKRMQTTLIETLKEKGV